MVNLQKITVDVIESNIHKHMISTLPSIWKSSRPSVDQCDYHDFVIDTQIMDFPTMTLEMNVPVFIRDILLADRTHVAWARTTRVDDVINNLNIVDYEGAYEFGEKQAQLMSEDRAREVTQDVYRHHLPMGYMSVMNLQLSLRSWVKMVKKLQLMVDRCFKPFANIEQIMMVEEVSMAIVKCLDACLPNHLHSDVLDVILQRIKVPKVNFLHSPEMYPEQATGGAVVLNMEVSYSLRAQIIRHRAFTVYDDYLERCINTDLLRETIGDKIPITIITDYESMRGIIEQRNCWLADSRKDMWGSIVDVFNEVSGDRPLPCDGGGCPFDGDCRQRVSGEDPGVPCPIHAEQSELGEAIMVRIRNEAPRMNFTEDAKEFWSNHL